MRHDRRIEERRRFECVFPAEKRANQEPARCRQRPIGKDMYLDPPVNAQQQRVQVMVTGAKFPTHFFEFSPSLLFAQRECATDDLSETRTVRRDERPDQHARTVRQKPQLMPPNLNRSHVTMGV
jgi:hypothetical protein